MTLTAEQINTKSDAAHQRTVNTIKGGNPAYADVYDQRVRHGVVKLQSGHRYEGCTYTDCLINAIGVEDIDLSACDLRGSTLHLENAANINVVANRWHGEYHHTPGEPQARNEEVGGRGAITTSGAISNVLLGRNSYTNVQRAFLAVVNHADIEGVTHYCEDYISGTRMTSAAGYNASGECVLYHGSGPGTTKTVRDVSSVRCKWHDWNPLRAGDNLRYDWPFDPSSYKRSALHFHDVNAIGIHIIRPNMGVRDVVRFVASKNYGKPTAIQNITIEHGMQGLVSAYGKVSLGDLGGLTLVESTSSGFYEAAK